MTTRRYQVQENSFSFGDNIKIKNDTGEGVLNVQAKLVSFADQFIFEDMNGNSLIKIEQELFHVRPTYKILSVVANGTSDRLLAVVKKNFTFLHNEFTIYSIYGPYSLQDLDIVAHSFILTKDGQTVAAINKKSISMLDTYDAEITSDQNQAFIFALVVVINRCLFNKDKHDHHN